MEYRTLGRTGLRVSAIGLGCEGFSNRDAASVRADIDYALAEGINFLDLYASDPALRSNIGAALEGRRERMIVQGHLGSVREEGQYMRTRDPEKSAAAFVDLLRRLGTGWIDIGMIHYVDVESDLREVLYGPVLKLALRLKAEGRIRHLGISSHNPVTARLAAESGYFDAILFSVNPCYDLLPPSDVVETLWADESYDRVLQNIDPERQRFYECCAREGVGISVMKAFGGGDLLSAELSPLGRPLTVAQCLEYALTRPAVASVMAGCRSRGEIAGAVGGAARRLPSATTRRRSQGSGSSAGRAIACTAATARPAR